MAKFLQYRHPEGGGDFNRRTRRSPLGFIIGGIGSLIGGVFLVLGIALQTLAEIGIGILSIVVIVAVAHLLLSLRCDRR